MFVVTGTSILRKSRSSVQNAEKDSVSRALLRCTRYCIWRNRRTSVRCASAVSTNGATSRRTCSRTPTTSRTSVTRATRCFGEIVIYAGIRSRTPSETRPSLPGRLPAVRRRRRRLRRPRHRSSRDRRTMTTAGDPTTKTRTTTTNCVRCCRLAAADVAPASQTTTTRKMSAMTRTPSLMTRRNWKWTRTRTPWPAPTRRPNWRRQTRRLVLLPTPSNRNRLRRSPQTTTKKTPDGYRCSGGGPSRAAEKRDVTKSRPRIRCARLPATPFSTTLRRPRHSTITSSCRRTTCTTSNSSSTMRCCTSGGTYTSARREWPRRRLLRLRRSRTNRFSFSQQSLRLPPLSPSCLSSRPARTTDDLLLRRNGKGSASMNL